MSKAIITTIAGLSRDPGTLHFKVMADRYGQVYNLCQAGPSYAVLSQPVRLEAGVYRAGKLGGYRVPVNCHSGWHTTNKNHLLYWLTYDNWGDSGALFIAQPGRGAKSDGALEKTAWSSLRLLCRIHMDDETRRRLHEYLRLGHYQKFDETPEMYGRVAWEQVRKTSPGDRRRGIDTAMWGIILDRAIELEQAVGY